MTEPKLKYAFFVPYKGIHYNKGINGKKVLVLGASFYCPLKDAKKANCTKHSECTNYEKRATSEFNKSCPIYKENGSILSEEPDNELTSCPNNETYGTFGRFLKRFIERDFVGSAWDYVSFTNYVQFMQQNWETLPCYLTERDYLAFIEVVQHSEYDPDVVIVWGKPVREELQRRLSDSNLVTEKTNDRVWKIQLNNEGKERALVFVHHPICAIKNKEIWDVDFDEMTDNIKLALR